MKNMHMNSKQQTHRGVTQTEFTSEVKKNAFTFQSLDLIIGTIIVKVYQRFRHNPK